MLKNTSIDKIRLDGGILCLDFVNTIPDRVDGSGRDNLRNFNDLIYWSRKAQIIDNGTLHSLERVGKANDRKAKDFFSEAINLRSLTYHIFQPISQGRKVKPADLVIFNKLKKQYFQFLEVDATKDGYVEEWSFDRNHFFSITAPIVKSIHDLLLSNKLEKVRECPNCGWLFLDTTKNGKRRWCSMKDCGSNVKAREYYYRKKKTERAS